MIGRVLASQPENRICTIWFFFFILVFGFSFSEMLHEIKTHFMVPSSFDQRSSSLRAFSVASISKLTIQHAFFSFFRRNLSFVCSHHFYSCRCFNSVGVWRGHVFFCSLFYLVGWLAIPFHFISFACFVELYESIGSWHRLLGFRVSEIVIHSVSFSLYANCVLSDTGCCQFCVFFFFVCLCFVSSFMHLYFSQF